MRVLLKLTGESLKGKDSLDYNSIENIYDELFPLVQNNIQIGIVVGGGNIYRGKELIKKGIKDYKSHYMGMLATIINSIAIQEILSKKGIKSLVFSSISIPRIVKFFNMSDVEKAFEEGYVLIYAGGTGNPFFTTDSAASLKAAETSCNILIKATKVDGIYDKDPVKFNNAKYISYISYDDFINQNLKIMDRMAIEIAQQSNIPIIITNFFKKGNLSSLLIDKKKIGSLIYKEDLWPI